VSLLLLLLPAAVLLPSDPPAGLSVALIAHPYLEFVIGSLNGCKRGEQRKQQDTQHFHGHARR
jgi:hypothetical protein